MWKKKKGNFITPISTPILSRTNNYAVTAYKMQEENTGTVE